MLRIPQHIGRLLLEHDCVIVPGLGGFVGNYQPAKIHPTSFIFNSPSKSIAFNINLKNNDGLLISSIAEEERLTLQHAENEVKQFVHQIREALHDHKPVKLPGIGRLTVDIENNIQFIPDNSTNYLPASYGLYSFVAPPVVREREQPVKRPEPIKIKPVRQRRKFSDVLLPVAAVLLLVLITVQIYIQSRIQGYDYAEILGLDKIFHSEELILDRYKPVDLQINPEIIRYRTVDTAIIKAPVQIEEAVNQNTQTRYFLIAGSLRSTEAAQKIIDDLKSKNYDGFILQKNGYDMVAIEIPNSMSPASYREIFIGKTGIDDAWVVRNK